MNPPPAPLIDWDQLDAIADGWPEDFLAIFREFVRDLPSDFEAAGTAIAKADAAALKRHAHQAKGSAANFGFEGVRACALAMEDASKAGDFAAAAESLAAARQAFVAGLAEVTARVPVCRGT